MNIHWTIQLVSSIVYIAILTLGMIKLGFYLVNLVTKVTKHEELYRSILKAMPTTIVAVDWYASKILYINNISSCLLNTTSNKDLLSMTPVELFPFISEEQWIEIRALVAKNKNIKMVIDVTPSIQVQLITNSMDLRNKKVVVYTLRQLKQRITEQTPAVDLRSRYEVMFDAIPTPLALSNKEGQILLVNQAFCLFTQYTKDEIENKTHILQFISDEDKDRVASYIQGRSAENAIKQYSYSFNLIKRDHTKWLCSAKVSMLPDSTDYIASVIEIEYLH